ncbi:PPC domain-containing protein [Aggregatilinea lenta]|uniref:PPC domain-containing protein n=1 Tax=Aggregatilinea lenta TaxID=913108 RepID=UPI0013C30DEF|nr:PPC domain-containing protein [Aggregatilinea lenta]
MRIPKLFYSGFVVGMLLVLAVSPALAAPFRQGQDPTPLVYSQTVDGTLSTTQPSAFYAFDGALGDVVTITMVAAEGEIDPFLVLNDSNQNLLATDDNSGGDTTARLTFVIPSPGRYVVQATHSGGVVPDAGGTFTLNLSASANGQPLTGEIPPSPTPDAIPSDSIATEPPPTEALTESPAENTGELPTEQGDSSRLVEMQSGDSVRDALDRQTAFRLYWFEGHAEGSLNVTPEATSSDFQPLLVLYDSSFAELQRGPLASGMAASLPADDIYFLAVSLPDTRNAGGSYGFTFSQSGLFALGRDAQPVDYNQPQEGNIDAAVPVTAYRFQGRAGETVTVSMSRTGGDLDSYLYLLSGEGDSLDEDNNSGGQNGDAQVTYPLPADGDYVVVATRVGQENGTTSGSYVLTITTDQAPAVTQTTTGAPVLPPDYADLPQIGMGEIVEGELDSTAYMDVYVFLGSQGEMITVDMESGNPDDLNGLDPLVVLLDDERIPLSEHDDIVEGEKRDSHLVFTLPRDAYYAIVATRFDQAEGTSEGPYTLTLSSGNVPVETAEPETVEAPVEATLLDSLATTPLEPNVPVQATFDAVATLYSFSGEAGSLVDLAVTADEGLDSVLVLADSDLDEVLSSGNDSLSGVSLPDTGDYLVILAPRFGPVEESAGGYILALTQSTGEALPEAETPSGPDTSVLSYGQTVSGTINDEIVSEVYTFSGSANDPVRITMRATADSALDCYLELQDADGNVVDANDDIDPGVIRDSRINTKLPADGTYTIIASRYVGPDADPTAGDYQLTLEMGAAEDIGSAGAEQTGEIIAMAYGDSVTGEIGDEQYLLFYVFDGTANDVVTITLENLSGNLDSVMFLYQSTDTGWVELTHNDDSPLGGTYESLLRDVTLPATGKYLIAVTRYGMESEHTAGAFTLTLTRQ